MFRLVVYYWQDEGKNSFQVQYKANREFKHNNNKCE